MQAFDSSHLPKQSRDGQRMFSENRGIIINMYLKQMDTNSSPVTINLRCVRNPNVTMKL